MTSEPKIDGAGKFYCPFCAHKRAVVSAERVRLKAMKAKEVLSKFVSMSSRVSVVQVSDEEEENRVLDNHSKDNAGVGIEGGGGEMEEQSVMDAVAPESGDFQGGSPLLKRYKKTAQRLPAVQRGTSPSRKSSYSCQAEDVVTQNGEERSEKDRNHEKGDEESSKVRRSQTLNLRERVTPLEFDLNRVVEWDRNAKDTDYISAEPSRKEIATYVSSESRDILELSQNEKATEVLPKSATQVPDSNQNVETNSSPQPINVPEFVSDKILFESTKRRKISWKPEELKDGVKYFSMHVNKNLPWKKILEKGSHIFHTTRTPDNLKDKWNVLCKEASKRRSS